MSDYDIIIAGAGPAGIFTALETLRLNPDARVLMADLGVTLDKRDCPARKLGRCVGCKPCNIMCGWAGAGAFSDGKLSLSEEVGGNLTDYISPAQVRQLIAYADAIGGCRPLSYGDALLQRIVFVKKYSKKKQRG